MAPTSCLVSEWKSHCRVQQSGQSFDEPELLPEESFKNNEKKYTEVDQIKVKELKRWLDKSKKIQWDYKNIIKRKGVLEKLF